MPALQLLMILMVVDVVTGILAGRKSEGIQSAKSYLGLRKKAIIVILVETVVIVQYYASAIPELGAHNIPAATTVALLFCIHERISIVENAARGGVPIPKKWRTLCQKLLAAMDS